MGFNVVLTDAAISNGVFDQSSHMEDAPPGEGLDSILGIWLGTHSSWGTGQLLPGQSGTISIFYSSGDTIALSLTLVDASTANLTEIDLFSPYRQPLLTYSGSVSVSPTSLSSSLSDSFLLAGNDTITGNSANNRFQGYGGNDTINGGAGTDTAVFSGTHTDYHFTQAGSALTVTGPDGTDQLNSVERLQFDDGNLAFDFNGTAGEAYRLYQAAFNRVPDVG
ncbi:MAG TPA: hypothetical protein VIE63_13670, partial [Ramlibacter sp.]